MITINSILQDAVTNSSSLKTLDELKAAQTSLIARLNESKVKDQDKKTMVKAITSCLNIKSYQRYICNALLKYEGMGLATKAVKAKADDESSYEMNIDNI